MKACQGGGMHSYVRPEEPTARAVWIVCLECRSSRAVATRSEYMRFDEVHRQMCGRNATVTAMFGDFDQVLGLPAS